MDRNEFVVILLSVGKGAALREPGNPAVYAAHTALRDAVAACIGEGSERMLFEALIGLPQDDLDWLKRFVRVTGMADDPPLYAACLALAGTIVVWASDLGAENIFPYHLERGEQRIRVSGGETELFLSLDGRLAAPDADDPTAFIDLGRLVDTIMVGRLLPGDLNVEAGLRDPEALTLQSAAPAGGALSLVTG